MTLQASAALSLPSGVAGDKPLAVIGSSGVVFNTLVGARWTVMDVF